MAKSNIIIPKKALYGLAPAIAIIAVLFSRHASGEVLLFLVGIIAGILIAKGYFKK